MGENPVLTKCGIEQANMVSKWLINQSTSLSAIKHIVVSPFMRTLQTAVPLAMALNVKLKIDFNVREARAQRLPDNTALCKDFQSVCQEIIKLNDRNYNTHFPLTAEDTYQSRMKRAAENLKKQ